MTKMMRAAAIALAAFASAAAFAEIYIVPRPVEVRETGDLCALVSPTVGDIQFANDPSIPAEGYRLTVTRGEIKVRASDDAGRFYALQTIRLLASHRCDDGTPRVPCVEINDYPRYSWRGLHLDESRHFFGKAVVKGILDQMAKFKLNRFHWHLTDDQGWRIAIPKYPEIEKNATWRPFSMKRPGRAGVVGKEKLKSDGKKYGPYCYTEADIKEIVAYAKARHIEVLPEIEFPKHFRAALGAYPNFACFPERVGSRGGRGPWGADSEVMCAGNDDAVKFVEDTLDYVCRLFPFGAVHIGGAGHTNANWAKCPKCQARIDREGLRRKDGSEAALYAWLVRRMAAFLTRRGKRAVCWFDELGRDGLPDGAIGMLWRDNDKNMAAAAAAAARHDMVFCPGGVCALSLSQNLKDDPYIYAGADRTLEKCYAFDPSKGLDGAARDHVLGGQGCLWTEYTFDRGDAEWKCWPRMMAIAETLWLGEKKPGLEDFKRRARVQREALVKDGVNAAPVN